MLFAVPFIISNFIQALYNVADMIIVGQFSGTVSMSGVNIGGQITLLMTYLVIGLSSGASVLIGQYKGYGARKELKETIGTLFTTLLALAVVMTIAMELLRNPLLRLINTPAESFSEARSYLFITMLGVVFIFGYNALSAVMRGLGDSKRPLIFVSIACGVNIVLDFVFVAGLKMGASGAALATVISQATSMILCIIYLKRNDFIFDFKFSSFGFHKERLKMLLKIGLPTSIQNVIGTLSFMFLTAMVNTFGVTASAAVGAVGKFNSFAILPASAISASIGAMSAQNIGAGREERAVQTMKVGMVTSFCLSVVVFVLASVFPAQILRLFADDEAMIAEGMLYLKTFKFNYLFASLWFSFNGLFIGSGHTKFSLFNGMMASILIRVPVAYLVGIVWQNGLSGVGMGGPVASFIGALNGLLFFLSGRWRRPTVLKDKEKLSV